MQASVTGFYVLVHHGVDAHQTLLRPDEAEQLSKELADAAAEVRRGISEAQAHGPVESVSGEEPAAEEEPKPKRRAPRRTAKKK